MMKKEKNAAKNRPVDAYPYWMWEGDVIDHVQTLLDCPRGDAQGVVEAQDFYMTQWWARGMNAEQTAHFIINQSKA
jgi:hypothetical protein